MESPLSAEGERGARLGLGCMGQEGSKGGEGGEGLCQGVVVHLGRGWVSVIDCKLSRLRPLDI